jgi:single-stranded-DNA-specific exonuclease
LDSSSQSSSNHRCLRKTADLNSFQTRLDRAKNAIEKSDLKEGLVLHHDEADGLCSGALVKVALERLGLKTSQICLDKLYPEVVQDVEAGPRRVIAYADIGSGHVEWLTKSNKSNNIILALDHHDTLEVADPSVHNLNPELEGFSGEKDASSSTVGYMFAKSIDPSFIKLSPLAIIGANEIPGEIQSLNRIALEDGEKSGRVHRTQAGSLKLDLSGASLSPSRASTILNVLGSVGYYQHGPETGIKACINGFDKKTVVQADRLEEERKNANRKMLSIIREGGLAQLKNVQWFHARDNYKGMSGKVVGSFCSYLSYQRFVNPVKYLIGMMNIPPDIPGWGRLPSQLVKVSGRARQPLAKMIETGKRPPLSRILPDSCEKVGGFGDGHTVAASGVFPIGSEEAFLEALDTLATTAAG